MKTPPELDVDPYATPSLIDPYEMHCRMRDVAPVVFLPRYGCYAVTRHAEVHAILGDWKKFSSAAGTGIADIRDPNTWRVRGPIVECDPPDHTAVRTALQRILSPVVIRTWREKFEQAAENLVDALLERRTVDGVKDIAETFVFGVFPEAVGLVDTPDRAEKLLRIGEHNFNTLGPKNELFAQTEILVKDIMPWYATAFLRTAVRPGGFGEQIFEAGDRGEFDPALAPGLLHSFLRGGMDTTISGLGHALFFLATQPDQWQKLRDDPSLARAAFEESIRLETPLQYIFRTTTEPLEFAGYDLKQDIKIQLSLGSANRDPRFWQEPDVYDISRRTIGHAAFGDGIHVCIGQMIARLEGGAVLAAMAKKVSSLELGGQPVRRINNALRSLRSLPLRLT